MNFTDKHILLLTSTNLACNPRCLKELRLMVDMKISVTVVAFNLHNWSTEREKELNEELPGINYQYLESCRKDFFSWLLSSIFEKMGRVLIPFFSSNLSLYALAVSKRSWLLLSWCKSSTAKPDLIIAHNAAAFYPAYWLAKKNKIPFALDIEDYHPGETIPATVKKGVSILMKNLIEKSTYASYGSPLIMQYCEKLLGVSNPCSFVINNFFPGSNFKDVVPVITEKIQLVWFSQNIDKGRGLEELLSVFVFFDDVFELTLIGNPIESFCSKEIEDKKGISIINSVHPTVLNKMIGQFDIGLAIEPGKDLNNTIALSNKILTYFQSGLFILASDTLAQQLFMQHHPGHGICSSLKKESLTHSFERLVKDKEQIRALRSKRFKNAAAFNWENESAVLKEKWEAIFQ